jgi:ssDNA-binding replication factor A large subunit
MHPVHSSHKALAEIEIDGGVVARALGLDTDGFRTLMDDGKVGMLCERGTECDVGKARVTFWYRKHRACFLFDGVWSQV